MKTLTIAALGAALGLALPAAAQEAPKAEAAPAAVPAGALAQVTPALATPASPPSAADAGARTAPATPRGATATFYGFVNLQYSRTDAPSPAADTGTFETRRARIGARGDVVPQVGYNVLFDAADTSLKDAYLAAKKLPIPGLELRAGQWKTPFGYEQQESDTKTLWVYTSHVVQALARSTTTTSSNGSSDARDLGVGLVGKWSLPGSLAAEVAASVTNGAGPNRKDDLDEKNAWGRAGLVAKAGKATIRAGGSYGYGRQLAGLGANGKFDGVAAPVDDTSLYFHTYGGDAVVDTPWLFLATEVIQSERDVWNAATGVRQGTTARGWYAGAYGKTPWNLGPVFRVEQYDRNRAAAGDRNERYTIGAYVDVLPVNARFIFNYELDESDAPVRTGDRAILFGQVIF
jgi:hypothetical protein